jgi:hypothetical protein
MLGFKIIKQSEYDKLTKARINEEEVVQKVIDGRKKIEADCESLREQLNDKIKRLQHLGSLNNLYVLKSEDYPCNKCTGETDKCMKLTFANQTICVVEKKYVNDFSKKTTAKKSKK